MPFITQGKTNWKFLSIVIILAIIVGAGALWYAKKQRIPIIQLPEIKETENINKEAELIAKCMHYDFLDSVRCFRDIFEKENYNEKVCERIEYGRPRDPCYVGAAMAKKDETLCEKTDISMCNIFVIIAKEEGTLEELLTKCENSREKIPCYRYIFEEKGYDEKLCEKIEKIEEKDYCYHGAAMAQKTELLCENIKSVGWKITCYENISMVKKDESLCQKIKYPFSPDNCYAIAAMAKKDETLCERIMEPVIKSYCYEGVAVAKGNEDLCEKVEYDKDMCLLEIAVNKLDENLCEEAGDEKNNCYFKLAELKAEEKICEKLEEEDEKNLCIETVTLYKEK